MQKNTKEIFKAILSGVWKYILCFVLGAMVMANCKGCQHGDVTPVIIREADKATQMKLDSLQFQNECHIYTIQTLNKRIAVLDSVTKIIKLEYRKAKKEGREFIQNNPCDSVGILIAYDLTVAKCDTVIITDSIAKAELRDANKRLEGIMQNMGSMLQIKEKQLTEKDIDLGIEQRKVKIERRKRIITVVASIAAMVATIFISK